MSLLSKSSNASARITSCSSRVKPFTPAFNRSSRRVQQLVARATEEEAVAEAEAAEQEQLATEEFDFNYSDAKKGNAWQPSDVEAALAYYTEEKFLQGSSELPYEAEFVTNPLSAYVGGPEDSSWLADVDNNEAYENDDYALAGIPEAAPKVKRNQREEEDDANEEELRAVEDEKITAAAFDDVEGFEDDGDDNPEAAWNWRFEGSSAFEEEEVTPAGVRVSDEEAFIAGLSSDISSHDELSPEAKDLMGVLLDAMAGDEGLDLIGADIEEADAADVQGLSQEEEASIAALLAEEVDTSALLSAAGRVPDLAEDVAAAEEEAAGRGAPLAASAVDEYIAALRAVDVTAAAGVDDATLSRLLGVEGGEEVAPGGPEVTAPPAAPDMTAALAAEDPAFESFLASAEADPAEAEAASAMALLGEMELLAGDVNEYNDMVFPADEDLQEYEGLVDAALAYYEAAGDEGAALAERPEDVPVNMYEDINPELLGGVDAFGDEQDSYARSGQFVERILELGRVTKVVKGGKIMGFRCVAVVGDGKGRVGVGCQAGREVSTAVKRALVDAKKSIIEVPLVGSGTIPHRSEAWFKAAGVVLQPAAEGTGVIAGGAVRSVLELAGVQNVLAKRLGSRSCLNNARVTLKALSELRTMNDYAAARGIPLDYMLS